MIQMKLLDDSAENLGCFSRNSWMFQLKLLDDLAETLGWFS
jgi:hypothetical protein